MAPRAFPPRLFADLARPADGPGERGRGEAPLRRSVAARRRVGRRHSQAAEAHASTPQVEHLDALGRAFVTIADNGLDPTDPTRDVHFASRVELDIEGNHLAVRDAIEDDGDRLGRVVTRHRYDMVGRCIHQASMEAGQRWTLPDATGKPVRSWDSRGSTRRMTYDELRRPAAGS